MSDVTWTVRADLCDALVLTRACLRHLLCEGLLWSFLAVTPGPMWPETRIRIPVIKACTAFACESMRLSGNSGQATPRGE